MPGDAHVPFWVRSRRVSQSATQPTCSRCGTERPDDPLAALAWVSERDRRGVRWLCRECARIHVRDIESKLDQDWW
jgi:hypothetical protein